MIYRISQIDLVMLIWQLFRVSVEVQQCIIGDYLLTQNSEEHGKQALLKHITIFMRPRKHGTYYVSCLTFI